MAELPKLQAEECIRGANVAFVGSGHATKEQVDEIMNPWHERAQREGDAEITADAFLETLRAKGLDVIEVEIPAPVPGASDNG